MIGYAVRGFDVENNVIVCRYGFPFDRHDWYVDRNGKEVRYVIDYYFNPDPGADVSGGPVGNGDNVLTPRMTKAIHVDVRPAVDDFTSFVDRLSMFPSRMAEALRRPKFKAEGIDPSKSPKEAAAFALHSSDNIPKDTPLPKVRTLQDDFDIMDKKCRPLLEAVHSAATPEEKQKAVVALKYCSASVVCPHEAKSFMDILERSAPIEEEEAAFQLMSKCVIDKMHLLRSQAGPTAQVTTTSPGKLQ